MTDFYFGRFRYNLFSVKHFSYNVINYFYWDLEPETPSLSMSCLFETLSILLHELSMMRDLDII